MKLRAPPGPQRSEVMQLLEVFRARCVDVSDQSLTVCCSGDAGKVREQDNSQPSLIKPSSLIGCSVLPEFSCFCSRRNEL